MRLLIKKTDLLKWIVVALLSTRLLVQFLVPAWTGIQTDFPNYYIAAWAVVHRKPLVDLYDPAWFIRWAHEAGIRGQPALFNYFPPFTALVMAPIASFAPPHAKQLWTVLNLVCLVVLVTLMSKMTGVSALSVVLLALLAGDSLGNNFLYGQFYIVLTLLLVLSIFWNDRRPELGGAALGLAAVVKLFPAIFIAYFAWARQWRMVVWSLFWVLVFSLLGLALMGWVPHRIYLEEVMPRAIRGEIQDPYHVHSNSLQVLMRRAFVREPAFNPQPIFDLPGIFYFLRPFVAGLLLAFSFRSVKKITLIDFGLLVSLSLLLSPVQGSYLQFMLFPGVVAAWTLTANLGIQLWITTIYVLVCSSVLGVTASFKDGTSMLLAFPRAYLLLILWAAFRVLSESRRERAPILQSRTALGLAAWAAICGMTSYFEMRRLHADDNAQMVAPAPDSYIEIDPVMFKGRVIFSSLGVSGYTLRDPNGILFHSAGDLLHPAAGDVLRWEGPDLRGPSEPVITPTGEMLAIQDGRVVGPRGALFHSEGVLHDLSVSPDGKTIAFAEFRGDRFAIRTWNGSMRTLLEGHADFRWPAYSPDGNRLAFATNSAGNWDIGILDLKTQTTRILTTSRANDVMPVFSQDGSSIYFASDRRRGYRFTAIYYKRL